MSRQADAIIAAVTASLQNTSFYLPPGYQPRVINGAWLDAFGGTWGSDAWRRMGTDTCMGAHGGGYMHLGALALGDGSGDAHGV